MKIKNILTITFLLSILAVPAKASSTCTVNEDDIYGMLFNGVKLWTPTAFQASSIQDPCDPTKVSTPLMDTRSISQTLGYFGMGLFLCFFLLEAIRRIATGQSLHFRDAIYFYVSSIIIAYFIATSFINGSAFADYQTIVTAIFIHPAELIVQSVMGTSTAAMMEQFSDAYASYSAGSEGITSIWRFLTMPTLAISTFIATFFLIISMVITWAVSMYLSLMCTVMMCIGPIFIPFLVFEPFAQVGWNWIRSMILYPFACIIGSIVSTLLINTNTLKFAVKAGQQASLFTVLTASSVLILMNVMVVSIAHSLVGGSSPSARGAGRTLAAGAQTFSNFGKGFTQIGAGTAGVAVSWGVKGASKAASAAGMSKLSNQMSGFGKTLNSNSQIAFKDGFKQPLWGSATNSGKGSNQAGPKTMNSNQGKRA